MFYVNRFFSVMLLSLLKIWISFFGMEDLLFWDGGRSCSPFSEFLESPLNPSCFLAKGGSEGEREKGIDRGSGKCVVWATDWFDLT